MEFLCEKCNYSTSVKFCYDKHLLTKKHAQNATAVQKPNNNSIKVVKSVQKNKYICIYCNNIYANTTNLSRHKKICNERINIEKYYENQIVNLKKMLEQKDETILQKDETISVLKSEVSHLKTIVNNTGSMVKTSISTMAYLIKNFRDAPVIETLKNYSELHNDQDNNTFINELIHQYEHQKLDMYIGNFIIKTYKKEDPATQSIWNSDTNRLTYLIRELLHNKADWKIDKKGIKTKKFIIEPILEYIDDQIRDYIQNFNIDYEIVNAKEAEKKMMKIKSATEIIKLIEDQILCEQVLKYIAPYFYLNKRDNSQLEL
jgi:hypothetical protein